MYLSYYNLAEKPFQIDTDPRFLSVWREDMQEALAVLKYGVLDRNGFVVLTGGIGTGKTTLLTRCWKVWATMFWSLTSTIPSSTHWTF